MRAVLGGALASLVATAVTIGVAAQTQAPPRDQPRFAATGSAAISGVVITDDEARAPLRAARVSIERAGLEDVRSTSTDDQGRYRFSGLPAGTYTINMGKPAYVRMEYGAPKPGMPGRTVVLGEGEQFAAATVALPRGAVIAGRLRDRTGRPVPDTNVTATQFLVRAGQRESRITAGVNGSATTNAHGEYRIYGLLPGEYVVYATTSAGSVQRETTAAEVNWTRQPSGQPPPVGRPFMYSPTWYPGTPDPQAAPAIRLAKGEERLGVDFALAASPVSRVSGLVTDPGGLPATGATVRVVPTRYMAFGAWTLLVARAAADGSFSFTNVSAGEYTVTATSGQIAVPISAAAQRITSTLWGLTTASLSGQDVRDLAIRLQPGLSVTGQVIVKGATAPAWDIKAARVTLVASGGPLAQNGYFNLANLSLVGAEGSFTINGVIPGSYRVEMSLPPAAGSGWSARSALAGSVDAIDVPIEIGPNVNTSGLVVTVTDSPAELSGTIADAAGRPAELYVFAFSTDRAHWRSSSRRIAFVRSTEKGTYAIRSLPPGEYYLCALTELDLQMRYEAEYLEQLVPASIRLTLGEGEKKQQNLQVGTR